MLYPFFAATLGFFLQSGVVYSQTASNDECVNAIVIPSDTTALPFIPMVDFELATRNVRDPITKCTDFFYTTSRLPSLWYKWVPSNTGIFSFSSEDKAFLTEIQLFKGNDCGSLVEIGCKGGYSTYVDHRLTANETYYIMFRGANTEAESDKTRLYVNATNPPPPNAVCSNAIDAPVGETITGNLQFTTFDAPKNGTDCGFYTIDAPTLWYKVTNNNPTKVILLASTCNPDTTLDTVITVFEGNNSCTSLDNSCVGGADDPDPDCDLQAKYKFLAKPFTTYYVALQVLQDVAPTNFTLSLDVVKNYFTLVDSSTDQNIDIIIDGSPFDYSNISSSSLNIEAVFDDGTDVKSVMVSFDGGSDSEYTRCERRQPFSVFRDTDGDFFDGKISAGFHSITANSYTQPDCKGEIGSTLSESLFIDTCTSEIRFYQVSTGAVIENSSFGDVDSLPCNDINIEAVLTCGFPIEEVQLTLIRIPDFILRDSSGVSPNFFQNSGDVVKSRTERVAPYYLFGNKGNVVNAGTINAGRYFLDVYVNGIEMYGFSINVLSDCN